MSSAKTVATQGNYGISASQEGRIENAPAGVGSTLRGLTRSSGTSREGLAMKATRNNRRRVTADPHPEFADAVSVSRFWNMVDKSSDCWTWTGDTDTDGYGVFFFHGRKWGAHELALSFTFGEKRLPSLDTCHRCDNPPCCNPDHLRFDTRKSNVEDMFSRGRANPHAPKLTAEDVVLMRERRANGARQIDLAEDFGVSSGYVSEVVRGRRWAHVAGPIQPNRKAS